MLDELKHDLVQMCQPVLDFCTSLGEFGLFTLAFMEASFFPIPPDFIFIPMILNGAPEPYTLAFIATVGSVLGAVMGYIVGRFGGRPVAQKILGAKADDWLNKAQGFFDEYGPVAIMIAAFTPIPFKAFTVSSGICKMNIGAFTFFSFLGRGGRFFAVTYLLLNFGKGNMEQFFKMSIAVVVILLILYIFFKEVLLNNKKA